MGIRIAICQQRPVEDIGDNLRRIEGFIFQNNADLYVFPELFLTGYRADAVYTDDIGVTVDRLRLLCNERDIAVAVGAPMPLSGGTADSFLFITGAGTVRYDKLCPARFGLYSEQFVAGSVPVLAEFRDLKIGLAICYDAFFPELARWYARHGADLIIYLSASAVQSKVYFDRVLPARALENTVYVLFCNNVGRCGKLTMAGTSRLLSPLGDTVLQMDGTEGTAFTYADRAVVLSSRKIRTHLADIPSFFRRS